MKNYPHFLFILLCLLFIASGIVPASYVVWVAEVIPVALTMAAVGCLYKRFRFSNWAYTLMLIWPVMHLIGAHFTFEHVPFEWFREAVGAVRNPFDRVGYFCFGFYAWPMAEYLIRKNLTGKKLSGLVGLLFAMALSVLYEMLEWVYAVTADSESVHSFLATQGDIWDAQKDMSCCALGAMAALILFYMLRPWGKMTQSK